MPEPLPGMFAEVEESTDAVKESIAILLKLYADDLRNSRKHRRTLGRHFLRLRKRLDHGQWMPFIEACGLKYKTVVHWMNLAVHDEANDESATVEQLEQRSIADLAHSEEEEPHEKPLCERCQRVGATANCQACKDLNRSREPGEDDESEDPANRIGKRCERMTKELEANLKDLHRRVIDKLHIGEIEQTVKAKLQLVAHLARTKPYRVLPPRDAVCKRCGAEIIWVSTQFGKTIALDKIPGGGNYDIMDGQAVKVEYSEGMSPNLFRCHFVRCHP